MKSPFITFLSIIICSSSLFITSCKRVRGDGNVTSDKRSLSEFKGVKLAGSMDVHLEIGDTYSVTIDADKNLLQYIRTEVEDGELSIGTEDNVSISPSKSIDIHVTAPSYNLITVSGSGNMYAKSLIDAGAKMDLGVSGSGNIEVEVKAESLTADISGSGAIAIKGSGKKIESSITGSGNLDASEFSAEDGNFDLAGSGNAKVRVAHNLEVHIAGSGDVAYYGSPKVDSHVAGSGSVSRAD